MSKRFPSPKRYVEASFNDGEPVKLEKPGSTYDALLAIAERDKAKPQSGLDNRTPLG
jgi:hypothetical protein